MITEPSAVAPDAGGYFNTGTAGALARNERVARKEAR
jgi:hypothetical protein